MFVSRGRHRSNRQWPSLAGETRLSHREYSVQMRWRPWGGDIANSLR
jgi:hypothetical protein